MMGHGDRQRRFAHAGQSLRGERHPVAAGEPLDEVGDQILAADEVVGHGWHVDPDARGFVRGDVGLGDDDVTANSGVADVGLETGSRFRRGAFFYCPPSFFVSAS